MRFMRLKEVMQKTGLGRTSIYNFMNEGKFPQSVSLGGRSVAWVDQEIEEWIKQTIEQRNENNTSQLTSADTNQ